MFLYYSCSFGRNCVVLSRAIHTYLSTQEGPQHRHLIAWSTTHVQPLCFILTVCALEKFVLKLFLLSILSLI